MKYLKYAVLAAWTVGLVVLSSPLKTYSATDTAGVFLSKYVSPGQVSRKIVNLVGVSTNATNNGNATGGTIILTTDSLRTSFLIVNVSSVPGAVVWLATAQSLLSTSAFSTPTSPFSGGLGTNNGSVWPIYSISSSTARDGSSYGERGWDVYVGPIWGVCTGCPTNNSTGAIVSVQFNRP